MIIELTVNGEQVATPVNHPGSLLDLLACLFQMGDQWGPALLPGAIG